MQTCAKNYLNEFLQTERIPKPKFQIGEKVISRWTSEEDGIERLDKGTIVGLVHLPICDHALVPGWQYWVRWESFSHSYWVSCPCYWDIPEEDLEPM
jgi:hypothetical protein